MLCLVCHCYACHNEAEHRCQVIICFASTTSAELHGEIPCPFTSFASPSSSDFALHAKHIPLDFTHALFRAKSVCIKSLTPKLPFKHLQETGKLMETLEPKLSIAQLPSKLEKVQET